jgi:hypothetical protein
MTDPLRFADREPRPSANPPMTRSKFVAMSADDFAEWVQSDSIGSTVFFLDIHWPEAIDYKRKSFWLTDTCYPGLLRHIKNWPTALLDKIEPERLFHMDCLLPGMVPETEEEAESRRDGFGRASGTCVCIRCGREYYEHPYDGGDQTYDGQPTLKVLCDLSRVKL